MRLVLVRHGEVQSNGSTRYWGHTDVPLSTRGIRQAEMLRQRLAKEKLAAVYSSDLRRALDTATIIAAPHRIPVVTSPELREVDFGNLEGMTFEEIRKGYPGAEKFWRGTSPGSSFPGGESLMALASRVDHFVEPLSKQGPVDTVLVVAHGGSLRVLVCQMLGLDLSRWWQIRIDPASLSVVEIYPDGAVLCLLNDVSHLEEKPRSERVKRG